jgi:hypothetical protein
MHQPYFVHAVVGANLLLSEFSAQKHIRKGQNTTADCFCRLGVRTGVGLARTVPTAEARTPAPVGHL